MPMPPCPFPPSKLAPSQAELDWLHDWLVTKCESCRVLEFGCGVTTWCIHEALKRNFGISSGPEGYSYRAIEDFKPCVEAVKKHLPGIIVTDNWEGIGKYYRELVFVDSSCGCGLPGLHREICVKAVEDHQAAGDILILHDWRKRSGKAARAYVESCGKYELIDSFNGRTGLGIYRRV